MTIRTQQDGYRWDPPAWCASCGKRRANLGSAWCIKCDHDSERNVSNASGGAGEQAAEAVREREAATLRSRIQPTWARCHSDLTDLILALRREGLHEAADEVTAGMDQIGKAVTRAVK